MAIPETPTALVLAGGAGVRMHPLTLRAPKPLAELRKGYCILDNILENLEDSGISRAVLLVGYKHELIEGKYGSSWHGLQIVYSVEAGGLLGTFGAVRRAISSLNLSGPAFIINGDIATDLKFGEIRKKAEREVTVLGVKLRSPYGILAVKGAKITDFREKPELPYWTNGGIYYLKNVEFLLKYGTAAYTSMENEIFPILAKGGSLGLFKLPEGAHYFSINDMKELSAAQAFFAGGR